MFIELEAQHPAERQRVSERQILDEGETDASHVLEARIHADDDISAVFLTGDIAGLMPNDQVSSPLLNLKYEKHSIFLDRFCQFGYIPNRRRPEGAAGLVCVVL